MQSAFSDLWPFVYSHIWIATTALAALIIATLAAYLRQQIRSATKWALAPITRHLPWNQIKIPKGVPSPAKIDGDLISLLTIVDVFITSVDGKHARYQKTSSYNVNT